MFIDTHAHLFMKDYNEDLEQVISNSLLNGVENIIIPATDLNTSIKAIEISGKYEQVYAAVGVHPQDSSNWSDSDLTQLSKLSSHKKVVAIGEIGLDYYYDYSPKHKQLDAFRAQLELAIEKNLPVVIHNRDANEDMMKIIEEFSTKKLQAQFHCFAGNLAMAKRLIELGHFISFTGNITYKKADDLREIAKHVQLENMLLETDSPFMSPVPFRGKRNEPSNVNIIAKTIAELQHLSIEDVGRTTNYNVQQLFKIGNKPKLSFTYKIGNSLYINVTNRCNADCVFCDRKGEAVIKGYNLKMSKAEEPDAEGYIKEIGDPKNYSEIVFCGYGEPTIRWEVVKHVAKYVKENGGKTRMNTNGHGNIINKRDITPELKNIIDTVSISLNSTDENQYAALMKVEPYLHKEMIEFAKLANNYTNVILSVVGLSDVDIENAKQFVQKNIGVNFRIREYFS